MSAALHGLWGSYINSASMSPNPTVKKYRVRSKRSPSPTWKAFLNNHLRDLVSIDFFVVPTVRLRVLFVLVVLAHDRRRVVHFNVTEHPTAQWTGQQIIEAFPWDTAPKYVLRDRDGIYGLRSKSGLPAWASKRSLPRREAPGRMPSWNASSAASGENAWTMSW